MINYFRTFVWIIKQQQTFRLKNVKINKDLSEFVFSVVFNLAKNYSHRCRECVRFALETISSKSDYSSDVLLLSKVTNLESFGAAKVRGPVPSQSPNFALYHWLLLTV